VKPLDQVFEPDMFSRTVSLPYLHEELSSMPNLDKVPEHIQRNIELAQNLLLYSHFVYDFATAAVHYAQIALEASLRRVLGKSEDKGYLRPMLVDAEKKGLLNGLSPECINLGKTVPDSRNGLAHGKEQRNVFNHVLAASYMRAMFEIIAALFSQSRVDRQGNVDQASHSEN